MAEKRERNQGESKGAMTTREAGKKGIETVRERHGEDAPERFGEIGGRESWTTGARGADAPHLDEETRREYERIREKQARGEALTTHEAGVLGGASRAMQARGEMEERED